jgi:hypothetical protein
MFAAMRPFAPPPPDAQPPLWGSEEHVTALLGDRVTDVVTRRRTARIDHFASPEGLRDYFRANHGPTIAVHRATAAEPERVAELDAVLADLGRRHDHGTGSTAMDWERLLLAARRTD